MRLENPIHLGNNVEVNGGECHQYYITGAISVLIGIKHRHVVY